MRVANGPSWHDNYGRPRAYYIPRIIGTIPGWGSDVIVPLGPLSCPKSIGYRVDRIRLPCPTENTLHNCMRYQKFRHSFPTIASLHRLARVCLGFCDEVAFMIVSRLSVGSVLMSHFFFDILHDIWRMSFKFVVSVIAACAGQVASTFVAISKRIRKRNGSRKKKKFTWIIIHLSFVSVLTPSYVGFDVASFISGSVCITWSE